MKELQNQVTIKRSQIISVLIPLFTLTSARSVLLILSPFLLSLIIITCRTKKLFLIFTLACLATTAISGIYQQSFYPLNTSISLIFVLLAAAFFSSQPIKKIIDPGIFIKTSTIFLLINAAAGTAQYISNPNDDSFIGIYGRSGLQNHGLATIYGIFFGYYLCKFMENRKPINAVISAVMIYSVVMCFYGSGLLVLFSTLLLASLLRLKIKLLSIFVLSSTAALSLINSIRPETLNYNVSIISNAVTILFSNPEAVEFLPRKIIAFYNYYEMIRSDFFLFAFGTSPGTFNSRTSFLLSGDYSSLSVIPSSISTFSAHYIFPLWNSEILSSDHNQGTMNQPFSSFISIFSEYGFVCGIMFFYILYTSKNSSKLSNAFFEDRNINTYFFNFLLLSFFMYMIFDNYIEYPEMVIVFFTFLLASNQKEYRTNENTISDAVTPSRPRCISS